MQTHFFLLFYLVKSALMNRPTNKKNTQKTKPFHCQKVFEEKKHKTEPIYRTHIPRPKPYFFNISSFISFNFYMFTSLSSVFFSIESFITLVNMIADRKMHQNGYGIVRGPMNLTNINLVVVWMNWRYCIAYRIEYLILFS